MNPVTFGKNRPFVNDDVRAPFFPFLGCHQFGKIDCRRLFFPSLPPPFNSTRPTDSRRRDPAPLIPSRAQTTGKVDYRKIAHVVGGHGPAAPNVDMKVTQSASLPVLTFDNRKFVPRKVRGAGAAYMVVREPAALVWEGGVHFSACC